jgi:hypothetical protein
MRGTEVRSQKCQLRNVHRFHTLHLSVHHRKLQLDLDSLEPCYSMSVKHDSHLQKGLIKYIRFFCKKSKGVLYVVFKGPVFSVFDISQQWLDGKFLSERGPTIIFHSLSIPKFSDYLDNGSLNCLHSRGDPPVFCRFYLL